MKQSFVKYVQFAIENAISSGQLFFAQLHHNMEE